MLFPSCMGLLFFPVYYLSPALKHWAIYFYNKIIFIIISLISVPYIKKAPPRQGFLFSNIVFYFLKNSKADLEASNKGLDDRSSPTAFCIQYFGVKRPAE